MIYKCIEDENGIYFGSDGKRYTLLEAGNYIDDASGRNVNVFVFSNATEAENYFGLTKAVEEDGQIYCYNT